MESSFVHARIHRFSRPIGKFKRAVSANIFTGYLKPARKEMLKMNLFWLKKRSIYWPASCTHRCKYSCAWACPWRRAISLERNLSLRSCWNPCCRVDWMIWNWPSRVMATGWRIWSSSMAGPMRSKRYSVTRWIRPGPLNCVTGCWPQDCRSETHFAVVNVTDYRSVYFGALATKKDRCLHSWERVNAYHVFRHILQS